MAKRYFEIRRNIHTVDTTIAADVMRHLHSRQYLGQAVIVCPDPTAMLQAAQRQWLKLSRSLQARRADSRNADDILRYTTAITHMQHHQIVAEPPHAGSAAQVYIVRPEQLGLLPSACMTVYLVTELPALQLPSLIESLPTNSLVVDYYDQLQRSDYGLSPKQELERSVVSSWSEAMTFLGQRGIRLDELTPDRTEHFAAFNDALDNLLEVNMQFLQLASAFQYHLDVAQPLRNIFKAERERYELFALLAHHVQTLSPGAPATQFLHSYADDSFFLRDQHLTTESLRELIARHEAAGRRHLAQALSRLAHKLSGHSRDLALP